MIILASQLQVHCIEQVLYFTLLYFANFLGHYIDNLKKVFVLNGPFRCFRSTIIQEAFVKL